MTSVVNVVKLVTRCKSSGIFELECSLSHQGVLCGCIFCKELCSSCLYISSPPLPFRCTDYKTGMHSQNFPLALLMSCIPSLGMSL